MRRLANLLFPVPVPVVLFGFALALLFATQPVWGLFVWGFNAVCSSFS